MRWPQATGYRLMGALEYARWSRAPGPAAELRMDPGYRVVLSGEAEDMLESFGYMGEALLMAIIMGSHKHGGSDLRS